VAETRITEAAEATRAYLDAYGRMLLIRLFEQSMHKLFLEGEVHGTTHLAAGQEAVPVGVCMALDPTDYVAGTYRGHGHALAKGTDPDALIAEMLGRATGVCGGRSGSMNVIDLEHGLVGCYGIVGGSIAAATGAALALKGTGSIAVAYFGDGATNQAYFFECLNFAKVLNLPVTFVCENNGYGEYTPMEQVTGGTIIGRAESMGVPARQVDGMDLWAVREAAREVTARVRAGNGPELVEALTYRFVGHSRSDPGKYRPPGELESWKERDPLTLAAERLRDEIGDEVDAIAEDVRAELERIEQAALAAPFPEPGFLPEFKERS
jgi:TPP-dependent pyruvate/acetoin dehydrogenase alpha subunit